MRKIVLSLCIIALVLCSVPMFTACNDNTVQYEFNDDNFGYVLNSDEGNTVTLSFLINKELANAVIPVSITNGGTTYTVTRIGEAVFAPISTGVTLSEVFKYDNANDESNDNLLSVTFPAGSKVHTIEGRAFERCKKLSSVTLPETLITIKGFVFYKCVSIAEITIPSSVKLISDYAFLACKGLTSVTLNSSDKDNLPQLGAGVFKWYDKSKVGLFGSQETYLLIDGLSIKVVNSEILTAFEACRSSRIATYRNWSDYLDIMVVEG